MGPTVHGRIDSGQLTNPLVAEAATPQHELEESASAGLMHGRKPEGRTQNEDRSIKPTKKCVEFWQLKQQ